MNVAEKVAEIEAAGATFRLVGEKVRVCYPDEERRAELAERIAALRDRRDEVAAYLKSRSRDPADASRRQAGSMELKEPPVAIETCTVVTDPAWFASTTLAQLEAALGNPQRWVGWSVPQLIDRLAQVRGELSRLESTSGTKKRIRNGRWRDGSTSTDSDRQENTEDEAAAADYRRSERIPRRQRGDAAKLAQRTSRPTVRHPGASRDSLPLGRIGCMAR